MTYKKIGI